MQLVVDTPYGWMINCACREGGYHYFPKDGRWTFNGDFVKPTFSPSLNECCNPEGHKDYRPNIKTSRCHFIVTDGKINYCDDCTHSLRGCHDMIPFDDEKIRYYASFMERHLKSEK